MTIFFTSDTHFGHANIIPHCKRPFASVEEMDETLIANWNAVVNPSDTVYHLGDFCWGDRPMDYVERLNGKIHLIVGNHDHRRTRNCGGFASVQYATVLKLEGVRLYLSHYPTQGVREEIHLHGHNHGMPTGLEKGIDVGVDVHWWRFTPHALDIFVEMEKVRQMVKAAGPLTISSRVLQE